MSDAPSEDGRVFRGTIAELADAIADMVGTGEPVQLSLKVPPEDRTPSMGHQLRDALTALREGGISVRSRTPLPPCLLGAGDPAWGMDVPMSCDECEDAWTLDDGCVVLCRVTDRWCGPPRASFPSDTAVADYARLYREPAPVSDGCRACRHWARGTCHWGCRSISRSFGPVRQATGKRITLVWPPTVDGTPSRPSLNLAYLAAALERADPSLEVSCIDTNLVLDIDNVITVPLADARRHLSHILSVIERTRPDILGVGAWTSNLPFALELVRAFRPRHPDVPVVMGGYPATEDPTELLSILPEANVLVRGEGEATFPALVDRLVTGRSYDDVQGLSYRSGSEVIHTPPAAPIKDLDALPFPSYERFVGARPGRAVTVSTSRGCPFSCTYCSNEKMYTVMRQNSPEYVVQELADLHERWGVTRIEFSDNLFTADSRWVERFCELLSEKGPELVWTCSSRVDTLTPDLIHRMSEVGLESIYLGLESVVPASLKFMGKTGDPVKYVDRARRLIAHAASKGVGMSIGGIVALPHENLADMQATVSFLEEMVTTHAPHVKPNLFSLIPFPGSPLWDAVQRGDHNLLPVRDPAFSIWNGGLFRELYWHLPWVVPGAFEFANDHLGQDEIERFVIEARARLQRLAPDGFEAES